MQQENKNEIWVQRKTIWHLKYVNFMVITASWVYIDDCNIVVLVDYLNLITTENILVPICV